MIMRGNGDSVDELLYGSAPVRSGPSLNQVLTTLHAVVHKDRIEYLDLSGRLVKLELDAGSNRLFGSTASVTGPAEVWVDDAGLPHRDPDADGAIGPAVIYPDREEYFLHGLRHRDEDQPAVISAECSEWWYQGRLHRDDDKPAIIKDDGSRHWYQHGLTERAGGPTAINADGSQEWRLEGDLHRKDGPAYIAADGTEKWYKHGLLHRDPDSTGASLPAIVSADLCDLEYYKDGYRHRADGPAMIYKVRDDEGTEYLHKEWHRKGMLHRTDGPAIEDPRLAYAWYLFDKKYDEKEWLKELKTWKELQAIREQEDAAGKEIPF